MTARTELLVQLDLIDKDEAQWRNEAACIGMGPSIFFPPRGHSAREAKAVCATCPVWSPCLEDALAQHDRLCVAGGRTEKERRVILRARRLGIAGYGPDEIPSPQPPKPRQPIALDCCHGAGCDCTEWKRRLLEAVA